MTRKNCHFKVHYIISALYLLSHLILLPEISVHLIFNNHASNSLRLHHQLYRSFSLCWRIQRFKDWPILSTFPTAPHYTRVNVRTHVPSFLCWRDTANVQNPSNWKEESESFQVLPQWAKTCNELPLCEETPELTSSNSRQLVQLKALELVQVALL